MRLLLIAIFLLHVTPSWAEARTQAGSFFLQSFGDLQADLRDAKKLGKQGVFLFFEQEHCPFCERMKTTILNQPEVQDAYHAKFLAFPIDLNGDTELIDFQGKPTKPKDFAFLHRVRATPVLLFFNLDGKLVARHTGPTKDKAELLLLGQYVAEGAYVTQPFAKYKVGK